MLESNHGTWEAEAGGFLSLRPAWSTKQVPGQPGLHRETLSWKTKQIKTRYKNTRKYLPCNPLCLPDQSQKTITNSPALPINQHWVQWRIQSWSLLLAMINPHCRLNLKSPRRHTSGCVLVTVLLLWRDTMTMETLIKKIISLGLPYSFRGLVHWHYGGEQGSIQADMVLVK